MSRLSYILLLGCVLVLSACANNPEKPSAQTDNGEYADEQAELAGEGLNSGEDFDIEGLEGIPVEDRAQFADAESPLSERIIYFDFDTNTIKAEFKEMLQAHAQYLEEHPNVRVRLEGHTDERGTREYNVALGERRAESVKKALVLSGADRQQVATLSYGEERPAVEGSSQDDYAKNRRVEFIYTK